MRVGLVPSKGPNRIEWDDKDVWIREHVRQARYTTHTAYHISYFHYQFVMNFADMPRTTHTYRTTLCLHPPNHAVTYNIDDLQYFWLSSFPPHIVCMSLWSVVLFCEIPNLTPGTRSPVSLPVVDMN